MAVWLADTPLAPRSAAYGASVTVLPCAHADFIALGVCQDPECSRTVVAGEPAAGREGGFDSGNGIVVRNSQIKMNSVSLRARFVHLLEPERRTATGRGREVRGRSQSYDEVAPAELLNCRRDFAYRQNRVSHMVMLSSVVAPPSPA